MPKRAAAEITTLKIPKTIGECADLLYATQEKRLAVAKQVTELEAQEVLLREHIIAELPKSKTTGVAGKRARVSVYNSEVPQVKDWDAFYKYVKKNNAFELMQKRLSTKAIDERLDAGEKLPGVERFTVVKVSLNKV